MVVSGYKRALDLAMTELMTRAPESIAENTGVIWDGWDFVIPWFGRLTPYQEGSIEERIIWSHYMLGQGPKALRNRHITFRQVPGAAIYSENFTKRCVNPMVKTFKSDLSGFLTAGARLGGSRVEMGHMAFVTRALPYIPLTFVIWQGDDEVPAGGNILFDESVIEWLCPEDLVVITGMPVYKMIKSVKSYE